MYLRKCGGRPNYGQFPGCRVKWRGINSQYGGAMNYHYLYQIVCLIPDENGVCKIYSGVRSSKVEPEIDNYFGSGLWIRNAVKKHGRENFMKIIVAKFNTREEADVCETLWLDKLFGEFYNSDWKKFNKHHYNLKMNIKGREGYSTSDATREKQSRVRAGKYSGEHHPMFGKKHTAEAKQKMSSAKIGKYVGENNPSYGVPKTETQKEKQREAMKGKLSGEKNPNYGKAMSEEQKSQIRKTKTGVVFKGLTVGKSIKTGKLVVCNGEHSLKSKGFDSGSVSHCISGRYAHHKQFTFTRATDVAFLRQLLAEDNFHDENSRDVIMEYLGL